MMTEGQRWALSQLRDISTASDFQFQIVRVDEPAEVGKALTVEISVDCTGYTRAPGGLPLKPRERFVLAIPADFPLARPEVTCQHTRFGGFPHVQWGNHLCLYQATDSEWRPDDGMYGFIQRLDDWLAHTARAEFDPVGFPLHPPAVYTSSGPMVIPRINTPDVAFPWWAGFAEITAETDQRIELGKWLHYQEDIPRTRLAVAILLPSDMPFEYPTTIKGLERVLEPRNVEPHIIRLLLEMAALRNERSKSIYFILGSASRGISGNSDRLQHLACWRVSGEQSTLLYTAAVQAEAEEGKIAAEQFSSWAASADINWCQVREDRPEIVIPRDSNSPLSWWRGKRVTLLGCGAIGSTIAMLLTRAGTKSFNLYDNGRVSPGLLVRQNFRRDHIGWTKVGATRTTLNAINPDLEVNVHAENIVSLLNSQPDQLFDSDVVINATASTRVAAALEKRFRDHPGPHPPIASMVVGHNADLALMTCAVPQATGITVDLDRRTKLAFCNAINGRQMLDEFWPTSPRKFFQPEPGCSEPTFVGSAADTMGLSADMLNILSQWLTDSHQTRSRALALRSPSCTATNNLPPKFEFAWDRDHIITDPRQDYQIRLSQSAHNVLMGWIRTSERRFTREFETGGLLFGQIDEFLKIVWVNEVSGPPPDSLVSPYGFICGTEGTAALNTEKTKRTRGSVRFIGMWHTHPDSEPTPSRTDLRAMLKLWKRPDFTARHFLMMIIGGPSDSYQITGNLFVRRRR